MEVREKAQTSLWVIYNPSELVAAPSRVFHGSLSLQGSETVLQVMYTLLFLGVRV